MAEIFRKSENIDRQRDQTVGPSWENIALRLHCMDLGPSLYRQDFGQHFPSTVTQVWLITYISDLHFENTFIFIFTGNFLINPLFEQVYTGMYEGQCSKR